VGSCRRAVAVVLVLVHIAWSPCTAGGVSLLSAGARVRVTVPGVSPVPLVASLIRVDADTLLAEPVAGGRIAIPLASVAGLEVSRGRGPRGMRALVSGFIGFCAGLMAGGIVGNSRADADADDPGATVRTSALAGGLVGGAAGAFVGACTVGERWESVPLHRPRAGLGLRTRGGVALSASFTF